MFQISKILLTHCKNSDYVKQYQVLYEQNGVQRKWDLIKTHSSVAVIIFNTSRNVLICVKQFRPGVYMNSIPVNERCNPIDVCRYPPTLGLSLEFCAGIIDKEKSLEEIAKEEVLEETGYDISALNLEKVQTFRCAVGVSGDIMTLFYTEVNDEMKKAEGGGLKEEGEDIEIVELNLQDAWSILRSQDVCSPSEFLYGLMWFFKNKKIYKEKSIIK